ncbi:MAG: DUF420 domain-containing protein [Planctomycetes bacterium]|nr:DUF420 domain-containing protein [Planctomycetota bacterium]
MALEDLPLLNASLNAASCAALLAGWRFAKAKRVEAHRAAMLTAVSLSTLFLCSYLVYHFGKEGVVTRFPVGGWPKVLYLSILLTHTPLAAALLPLIVVALVHAFRGNVEKHRRVVRWTFPVWVYVSVTGVLVYVMLYRIPWEG